MKIAIIKPISTNLDPWIPVFRDKGVEVLENQVTSDCDFILCATHSQVNVLEHWHLQYPNIPIVNYNWDLYGWIWLNPRGYDWHKYGEYLQKSVEIWVPSEEVTLRTEEFFELGSRCKLIKSFARFFDFEDVKDNRYILQPMRDYTSDKNFGWLKKACRELDLPLYESQHRLSEPEFQKVIAECSFICTEYHEASTGGLTLLEGYRLGKPVVVSDSIYMGARDYFGDKAIYFKDNDYEHFKQTIKDTWDNTPILNRKECVEFTNQYDVETMVDQMIERLECLKSS